MEPFKDFVAATDFDGAPSGWAWVGGSTEGWGGVWAWVDGSLMKELPWLYSQRTGGGVARRGQRHNVDVHRRDLVIIQDQIKVIGMRSPGSSHKDDVTKIMSQGRGHQDQVTRMRSPGSSHKDDVTRIKSQGRGHQDQVTRMMSLGSSYKDEVTRIKSQGRGH
ncbi:hypothetical protein Hamer_G016089 [Homarus americanus]|uniref:Uncharacterized protein n=1 Tax=Homarus americanus TaxID=6706 RepID=A0A8J5N0Q6_HOMAM|nr:hypothetical protein Hamer_G016089 [Homarus americanus]